ncbi:MAG: DEAD/DEAH box helicase [Methylophilaceae bacterium]
MSLVSTFASLELHPAILRAVEESGYTNPTPIQAQAIPEILAGHDLMASAQTGTGKTAGFTLPALNLLATPHASNSRGPRILVLVPTRELAAQVNESARKYGKYIRARTVSIVGGMPYPLQNKLLSQPLDILVATPGRFIDHMERGRIDLSRLQMLILDEADRMLDMGFMPDVERICQALPTERQTLLFSATLDGNIGRIARDILKNPKTIQVAQQKEKHANIEQRLHFVDDMTHKNKLLEHLLIAPDMNQAIIFTSTKRHADLLAEDLYAAGHKTAALHGDMTQGARNRTLTKLRHGDVKVLVATDVAARGIDVQGVSHVINYDLPKFAEDYVHRIGRTGRAGNTGIAISFASNMDRHILRKIEQFTGNRMEAAVIEGFEPKRAIKMDGPEGKRSASRGACRNDRNQRSHKPGGNGGYQPRSNGGAERNRGFGGQGASSRASAERTFSDKPAPSRNFGDRIMGDKPARNFSDNPRSDRPQSDRSFSDRSHTNNRNSLPRDGSGEINGNSRSYTKDTDMQFARELSKGFGSARSGRGDSQRQSTRNDAHAARDTKPQSFGEKFGNPRPQRTNNRAQHLAAPAGDRAPRRSAGSNGADGARRSRNFA